MNMIIRDHLSSLYGKSPPLFLIRDINFEQEKEQIQVNLDIFESDQPVTYNLTTRCRSIVESKKIKYKFYDLCTFLNNVFELSLLSKENERRNIITQQFSATPPYLLNPRSFESLYLTEKFFNIINKKYKIALSSFAHLFLTVSKQANQVIGSESQFEPRKLTMHLYTINGEKQLLTFADLQPMKLNKDIMDLCFNLNKESIKLNRILNASNDKITVINNYKEKTGSLFSTFFKNHNSINNSGLKSFIAKTYNPPEIKPSDIAPQTNNSSIGIKDNDFKILTNEIYEQQTEEIKQAMLVYMKQLATEAYSNISIALKEDPKNQIEYHKQGVWNLPLILPESNSSPELSKDLKEICQNYISLLMGDAKIFSTNYPQIFTTRRELPERFIEEIKKLILETKLDEINLKKDNIDKLIALPRIPLNTAPTFIIFGNKSSPKLSLVSTIYVERHFNGFLRFSKMEETFVTGFFQKNQILLPTPSEIIDGVAIYTITPELVEKLEALANDTVGLFLKKYYDSPSLTTSSSSSTTTQSKKRKRTEGETD